MAYFFLALPLLFLLFSCQKEEPFFIIQKELSEAPLHWMWPVLSPIDQCATPSIQRVTMPLGGEQGAFTYSARAFREENHLGVDLNGIGGENTDLGDSIYAVAEGRVVFSGDIGGGWGKMVILAHAEDRKEGRAIFQTVYAHLQRIDVALGQIVFCGEKLGSVGSAAGRYWAHLHLEWREGLWVSPDRGYADIPFNRRDLRHETKRRAINKSEIWWLFPSLGLIEKGAGF